MKIRRSYKQKNFISFTKANWLVKLIKYFWGGNVLNTKWNSLLATVSKTVQNCGLLNSAVKVIYASFLNFSPNCSSELLLLTNDKISKIDVFYDWSHRCRFRSIHFPRNRFWIFRWWWWQIGCHNNYCRNRTNRY